MMTITRKKVVGGVIIATGIAAIVYTFFLPPVQYELGNVFFGKYERFYNVDRAQYFYTNATRGAWGKVPEFAHYQLSRTYFIKGFFKRSIEEANKEIALYPNNKRTYYILGLTYGYMNREEEAIAAFSQFIEAYPDSWAARNDKAWLQFRIGDIEGALETIEPVATNLNPWVQNTYGTILLNLGRTSEAEQAFLQAGQNATILTPEGWGTAYPGNDPRVYETGLNAMKRSIESNLELVQ
jgi:tetratricopeptide (TPR) repeat protein